MRKIGFGSLYQSRKRNIQNSVNNLIDNIGEISKKQARINNNFPDTTFSPYGVLATDNIYYVNNIYLWKSGLKCI